MISLQITIPLKLESLNFWLEQCVCLLLWELSSCSTSFEYWVVDQSFIGHCSLKKSWWSNFWLVSEIAILNCSSGSITETLLIYFSVEGIFFSSASLTYSCQLPSCMLMLQLIVIEEKMYYDFLLQAINIEYSLPSCNNLLFSSVPPPNLMHFSHT